MYKKKRVTTFFNLYDQIHRHGGEESEENDGF